MKEACAKAVRLLSVSEALASKAERSSAVYRAWREWLRCPEPENVPVPNSDDAAIGTLATPQQIMKSNHSAYTGALTPVQHLLFVLAIRPDRSMPALRQYVSASLSEVRRAPAASISAESSPTTPCLFLCRNGEDGESTVGSLAALAGVPLIIRSVGIGQLSLIDATFRKASTEGSWLCLSNCHLAALPNDDSDTSSLLQHIEAELRAGARSATAFHPSFRLWLVSDVGTPLPSSLLQLCTIAVVDSTPGSMVDSIRSSIRRLPVSVLETIEDTDNVQWRKLVFMLCVLHATMVGRGKYARVGWSRQYRFSASDFAASVAILSRAIRDKQQVHSRSPCCVSSEYFSHVGVHYLAFTLHRKRLRYLYPGNSSST